MNFLSLKPLLVALFFLCINLIPPMLMMLAEGASIISIISIISVIGNSFILLGASSLPVSFRQGILVRRAATYGPKVGSRCKNAPKRKPPQKLPAKKKKTKSMSGAFPKVDVKLQHKQCTRKSKAFGHKLQIYGIKQMRKSELFEQKIQVTSTNDKSGTVTWTKCFTVVLSLLGLSCLMISN